MTGAYNHDHEVLSPRDQAERQLERAGSFSSAYRQLHGKQRNSVKSRQGKLKQSTAAAATAAWDSGRGDGNPARAGWGLAVLAAVIVSMAACMLLLSGMMGAGIVTVPWLAVGKDAARADTGNGASRSLLQTSGTSCSPGTYCAPSTSGCTCTPCPSGSFTDTTGTPTSCTLCRAGTYRLETGATSCKACPTGLTSNVGSTRSTDCGCPAGMFNRGSNVCAPCPAGSFSSAVGQTSCTMCAAGTYRFETGATFCKPCDTGLTTLAGATKSTDCKCPPGTFVNGTSLTTPGAPKCTPCPQGSFSSALGQASCTLCPAGTYRWETGATTCKACPPGYTSPLGAKASTECVCSESLRDSYYTIQRPFNLPLAERYTYSACIHSMRVRRDDQPFKEFSPTTPRTEMRVYNDYSVGTNSISFNLLVPSGTEGACVMQIFGGNKSYEPVPAKAAATSLQLRVYGGKLMRYNVETLATNIYDKWQVVNVTHNADSGVIQIYVNSTLVLTTQDRGTDTHYFKLGVYAQEGASADMQASFHTVRVGSTPVPIVGYVARYGWDIRSSDISRGQTNTCHDLACCQAQCNTNPLCEGFVFGAYEGKRSLCWIKYPRVGKQAMKRDTRFSLYLKNTPGGYVAEGGAFYGCSDLSLPTSNKCTSLSCCKSQCDRDTSCAMFAFAPSGYGAQSGPACWLKSTPVAGCPRTQITNSTQVISYTKTGTYLFEPEADYACGDISAPSNNKCNSIACCKRLCDSNPTCALFMFAPAGYAGNAGPSCWTKREPLPTCRVTASPAGGLMTFDKPGCTPAPGITCCGARVLSPGMMCCGHTAISSSPPLSPSQDRCCGDVIYSPARMPDYLCCGNVLLRQPSCPGTVITSDVKPTVEDALWDLTLKIRLGPKLENRDMDEFLQEAVSNAACSRLEDEAKVVCSSIWGVDSGGITITIDPKKIREDLEEHYRDKAMDGICTEAIGAVAGDIAGFLAGHMPVCSSIWKHKDDIKQVIDGAVEAVFGRLREEGKKLFDTPPVRAVIDTFAHAEPSPFNPIGGWGSMLGR